MSDSLHYELSCSGGGEGLGAPEFAVFDIDRSAAAFIIAMAALVKEHDLHKVEKFDYRVSWREDPSIQENGLGNSVADLEHFEVEIDGEQRTLVDMSSDCDCINISRTHFWFTCYRRHLDDEISSGDVAIVDMVKGFGIPFGDVPPPAPTGNTGAKGTPGGDQCLCVTECDCQSPDTLPALCSEECPIHNLHPNPHPDCPVHNRP